MTKERYDFLMWDTECFAYHTLRDEEVEIGWHWCPEWDGLLICPHMTEWGPNPYACICGYECEAPLMWNDYGI